MQQDLLRCRLYLFCGNWCRTASGNDCIFLCWRNADRSEQVSGDRTADPVCSVGTDFLWGERSTWTDRIKSKINGIKKSLSMDGIMTFSVQSLEKIYTIFLESHFIRYYNGRY